MSSNFKFDQDLNYYFSIMRIFVTGSTGFVGSGVVKQLLSAGHQVLGLTRNDKGVEQLKSQGAEALYGTIEDLNLLKKAASECDGVIHLAFVHNFADFEGSCATDRAAISALGSALAAGGGNRALVVTSGTMLLSQGKLNDEDETPDLTNGMAALRGPSESLCLDFAKQGVRASIVRLPPTVHGPGSSGFSGFLTGVALQKGTSAYVGEGMNHWCAVHRDDAAALYRLAVEKATAGSIFHAVAEEAVALKDIAAGVGKQLGIPVLSIKAEEAEAQFGWFQIGLMADNMASSKKSRERLGWAPTAPTVIEDLPVIVNFAKSQVA